MGFEAQSSGTFLSHPTISNTQDFLCLSLEARESTPAHLKHVNLMPVPQQVG